MSDNNTVIVNILDKEYQVACPPEQKDELLQSAHYLNSQMQTIRESGKVIGMERIAVMAALNISHELLQASTASGKDDQGGKEGVRQLTQKVDEALYQLRQLEIS